MMMMMMMKMKEKVPLQSETLRSDDRPSDHSRPQSSGSTVRSCHRCVPGCEIRLQPLVSQGAPPLGNINRSRCFWPKFPGTHRTSEHKESTEEEEEEEEEKTCQHLNKAAANRALASCSLASVSLC